MTVGPTAEQMYRLPAGQQAVTITGFEFNLDVLNRLIGPPPPTPLTIFMGKGRRASSPHPTRRQKRLCVRYGHPAVRLSPLFRGEVRELAPSGYNEFTITGSPLIEGRYCERCGAEAS